MLCADTRCSRAIDLDGLDRTEFVLTRGKRLAGLLRVRTGKSAADSTSTNAVNNSSARTTKRFPSSRCASAIQRLLIRIENTGHSTVVCNESQNGFKSSSFNAAFRQFLLRAGSIDSLASRRAHPSGFVYVAWLPPAPFPPPPPFIGKRAKSLAKRH